MNILFEVTVNFQIVLTTTNDNANTIVELYASELYTDYILIIDILFKNKGRIYALIVAVFHFVKKYRTRNSSNRI